MCIVFVQFEFTKYVVTASTDKITAMALCQPSLSWALFLLSTYKGQWKQIMFHLSILKTLCKSLQFDETKGLENKIGKHWISRIFPFPLQIREKKPMISCVHGSLK